MEGKSIFLNLRFIRDVGIIILASVFLSLDFLGVQTEVFGYDLNFFISILGGLPAVWIGIAGLFRFKINIDLFSSLAVIAAILFAQDYKAAEFIILMLAFARLTDIFTEARAKKAINELIKLKPKKATIKTDGTEKDVPVEDVKKGDIVIVKPGERIPVDGEIVEGETFVNEAPISGESAPVYKKVGDKVVGITVNGDGLIFVKTIGIGKETVLARIISLIEEAQQSKAPTQKAADRFATWFLPATLAIVALAYYFTRDVSMAISLLLVICADEIAVATPIAILAGIGQAARRGVIVKGGVHLEDLSKVTTVVLDKTGTLTYGRPKFVGVKPLWDGKMDDVLLYAGIAEKYSEHSVARPILEELKGRKVKVPDPEKFELIKGEGVSAKYQDKDIYIGNEKFMERNNFHIQESIKQSMEEVINLGSTPVLVAYDKKIAGIISIMDLPRETAKYALDKLKEDNIKVVMMTGDSRATAQRVANSLGISEVHSQMSPEDKLAKIKEMQKNGEKILMVGDGINDAPALSLADVGIAMGAIGTDVAIEASDITLMEDKLEKIPEVIKLSKDTMKVIKGNIILWIISNVVGVSFVLMGAIGPIGAAAFNFLTDFLPLGNSMRLFRRRNHIVNDSMGH